MRDIFYIGNKFYLESGTIMSSLYVSNPINAYRTDWGFIERMLMDGQTVTIRPATDEEMAWAEAKLLNIKIKRNIQ